MQKACSTSGTIINLLGEEIDITSLKPTTHINKRIFDRGIEWPTILAVILHGRPERSRCNQRVIIVRWLGFSVVLDGQVVITVHLTKAQKKRGGAVLSNVPLRPLRIASGRSRKSRLDRIQKREFYEDFFYQDNSNVGTNKSSVDGTCDL